MRSLSPSLILTWTLMVSPGPKFGMSVRRLFASNLSIIWFVMMFLPESEGHQSPESSSAPIGTVGSRALSRLFLNSRLRTSDFVQQFPILVGQRDPLQ